MDDPTGRMGQPSWQRMREDLSVHGICECREFGIKSEEMLKPLKQR